MPLSQPACNSCIWLDASFLIVKLRDFNGVAPILMGFFPSYRPFIFMGFSIQNRATPELKRKLSWSSGFGLDFWAVWTPEKHEEHHRRSRLFLVYYGLLWFTMVYYGLLWFTMWYLFGVSNMSRLADWEYLRMFEPVAIVEFHRVKTT